MDIVTFNGSFDMQQIGIGINGKIKTRFIIDKTKSEHRKKINIISVGISWGYDTPLRYVDPDDDKNNTDNILNMII